MGPPLSPLQAYESVMHFASVRGEDTLRLAMHASVPQVLRPELLHLLKLNFVPEAADDPAIETDVLLAPFCETLGNGYYRFDAHARRHLLRQLDPLYGTEDVARTKRVGNFLLSYFDDQRRRASSNDVVHATYVEVEQWVALAFLDPAAAARQFAEAVRQASDNEEASARVRITGLSDALTTPLAQHQALLAYAAGVEAIQRNDLGHARDVLEPLGDCEIAVGDVTLRSAQTVLDERMRPSIETPEEIDTPLPIETSERSDVESVSSEIAGSVAEDRRRPAIFISCSHRDAKWIEMLRPFLKRIGQTGRVETWPHRSIEAGGPWDAAIRETVGRSRVAVLLVTPNYLASESLMSVEFKELEKAARRGSLRIVWIPVEHCAWQQTEIAKFQAALDPDKPLGSLTKSQRERTLTKVAQQIDAMLRSGGSAASEQTAGPDIFICYRREAQGGRTHRLADRLEEVYGRHRIFQDITSIVAGENFLDVIRRRVETSSVMLVIIDPQWLGYRDAAGGRRIENTDDILRYELAAAIEHNVRLIPVLLADAVLPHESELPGNIASLTHWNAVRLSDEHWKEDVERLVNDIDKALGQKSQAMPVEPRAEPLIYGLRRLFIVIQRDAVDPKSGVDPIFNMDAEFSNPGQQPIEIRHMEIELTGPDKQSIRLPWNLFYEYEQPGLMQQASDASSIVVGPHDVRLLGVQFRGLSQVRDQQWRVGTYDIDLRVWLSSKPSGPPDMSQHGRFTLDRTTSAQLRSWLTASDQQWKALNDPHNAVAIKVELKR